MMAKAASAANSGIAHSHRNGSPASDVGQYGPIGRTMGSSALEKKFTPPIKREHWRAASGAAREWSNGLRAPAG